MQDSLDVIGLAHLLPMNPDVRAAYTQMVFIDILALEQKTEDYEQHKAKRKDVKKLVAQLDRDMAEVTDNMKAVIDMQPDPVVIDPDAQAST